ncbi:hypothetical protein [Robertmurraya korlensis]|uniref:hypothetical protein n=1 Tax=Robertmurraya korlensis TaxID=519977 RepID=UPI000826DCFD|nr:hypothetical protein [Robertmurraya korlensis]
MISVSKPISCKCSYRLQQAPVHPTTTDAEEWFQKEYLPEGYYGLNFDFFVDWTKDELSKEIWIKRTVNKDQTTTWPTDDTKILQDALDNCEGREYLSNLGSFASARGLILKYQIFKDSPNWSKYPSNILTSVINENGEVTGVTKNSISDIKNDIVRLSGKKMYVRKGLRYGTTSLECHLANDKTGAAWPGDVDILIFNEQNVPIAIVELKKNTQDPSKDWHRPIINEELSNYYSKSDKAEDNSKYNRIAILRDYLKENLPIIVVYYPSWETDNKDENIIKLESIIGEVKELESGESITMEVPYNANDKKKVVKEVLKMAGETVE